MANHFYNNDKLRLSKSIVLHLAQPTVFFYNLSSLCINFLVLYHNEVRRNIHHLTFPQNITLSTVLKTQCVLYLVSIMHIISWEEKWTQDNGYKLQENSRTCQFKEISGFPIFRHITSFKGTATASLCPTDHREKVKHLVGLFAVGRNLKHIWMCCSDHLPGNLYNCNYGPEQAPQLS